MTQKSENAHNASSLERAGKHKIGYNVAQVDAFLERAHTWYENGDASLTQEDIQEVSFNLATDGYDIDQVDAALARLENVIVDKKSETELATLGRVACKAQAYDQYRDLLKHALREEGERFASGISRKPSYDRQQVDDLINQVMDKLAVMLSMNPQWNSDDETLANIDADFVSNVLFTQRSGKRGYHERQVDYYLHACVRLLSKLESYDRLASYAEQSLQEPVYAQQNQHDVLTQHYENETQYVPTANPALPLEDGNADQHSIFATVAAQSESDDLHSTALHDRAIFTAHSASVASDHSKDDLQAATVLSAPATGVPLPPTFAPGESAVQQRTMLADDAQTTTMKPIHSTNVADNAASATLHSSSEQAYPARESSLPFDAHAATGQASQTPSTTAHEFEPVQRLNFDMPDLSFPTIKRLGGFGDASNALSGDGVEDSSAEQSSPSSQA